MSEKTKKMADIRKEEAEGALNLILKATEMSPLPKQAHVDIERAGMLLRDFIDGVYK